MFDAIFFDLDGTLIDTESIALRTGLEVFARLGHPADETFMHELIGKDIPSATALIGARFPGIDLDRLGHEQRAAFDAALTTDLRLKPGARELLAALPVASAIVTSSGHAEAHHKIGLTGLGPAFCQIITRADVLAPKPDPEPYLLAARRLGVDPARCLVFEDSEIGAQSAYRAGCTVVQVPDIVPASGKWAHHIAPDLLTGAAMAGLIPTGVKAEITEKD
ncbi:HAD family hydrolase [Paracoccus aminophilus]|uniref:HAD-superfamily hydrolase n=1 Tax=Paracoccus aminophilus JCM 7686 TaxID=1367847 RepID=S5YFV6_PARAH|nr:HAD family phosphatase [Paracoccus aminophilus]AGT10353.1 HAD-superfamily hydrolase [Paracoccus aminophilus JCM 7686]